MRDRRPHRACITRRVALLAAALLLAPAGDSGAAPLQCVQYVRLATSVPLKGDAWTWWAKAPRAGFTRGKTPEPGAILVMKRTDRLPRGHVAVVADVIGPREILIDHANWAPRRGQRGRVETGVRAIDVSAANDWSRVRVWYAPADELGTRVYPAYGFIYRAHERQEYQEAAHIAVRAED